MAVNDATSESDNISDQERSDLFDELGNDSAAWCRKAVVLLEAGTLQYDHFKRLKFDRENENACLLAFERLNIIRMLKGMAIECLLKALWIDNGNRLVSGGKLTGSLKTTSHDLVAMAHLVCSPTGVTLDDQEEQVLARLAFGIETGRYPVTSRAGKKPTLASSKVSYLHRWSEEDEQLLVGIIERLVGKMKT